jgi:hypothetical protein
VLPRVLAIVAISLSPDSESVQWGCDVMTSTACFIFFGKVLWVCIHKYLWWSLVNPCPAVCNRRNIPLFGTFNLHRSRPGYCSVSDVAPVLNLSSLSSTAMRMVSNISGCIRRVSFKSVWRSRERYDVQDEERETEEREMVPLIGPPSRFVVDRGSEIPHEEFSTTSREKHL